MECLVPVLFCQSKIIHREIFSLLRKCIHKGEENFNGSFFVSFGNVYFRFRRVFQFREDAFLVNIGNNNRLNAIRNSTLNIV